MAAPFLKRLEYANLWLLGGLVRRSMEAKPETNAAIRTTTAITIIHAGVKDNILPGKVTAKVNFRLMPGDTVSGVIEHVRNSMADERIQIHKSNEGGWEAPPPSPIDCDAFHLLERTVRQVFGNIPVAPYLVQGATDSKYYSVICDAIYRFSPVEVNPDDRHRVHGINERIQVDALARMVKFFGQLIPTWSEMS
jgi:carboxypeptidase PM20D1